ncbi:MAG: GNAT family N-acetyltransferase [Gammaproteobacteria bacterium]|nr:GNAT family N-acetyltransferase [Gammaproteobacteria bacterium]
MKWELKELAELTSKETFDYLKLRQDVFVVEQNCPYPDIDFTDLEAKHLIAQIDDNIVACARIIPPGVTYDQPSIGRITTALTHRGSGLGRELVRRAIEHTQALFPNQDIKIGAQERLESFYQSFGFETISSMYLEDGIPHIDMNLNGHNY